MGFDQEKSAGPAQRLMQVSEQGAQGFNEWLEERNQAHLRIGATLSELVDNGTLTVVEAGRTYASAVTAIIGYDELIAQGSPGPTSFGVVEQMLSRQPSGVS